MNLFGANPETFTVEVNFFPEITRDLLDVESLLRFGVLPLGYKMDYHLFRRKRCLNIGAVDAKNLEALNDIEEIARKNGGDFEAIKVYQIEVSQFLKVLKEIYGVDADTIKSRPKDSLAPAVSAYFEELDRAAKAKH